MATAMFYGVGKDYMFSRTVKELPGPELGGKILEAYSTIKQVHCTLNYNWLLRYAKVILRITKAHHFTYSTQ